MNSTSPLRGTPRCARLAHIVRFLRRAHLPVSRRVAFHRHFRICLRGLLRLIWEIKAPATTETPANTETAAETAPEAAPNAAAEPEKPVTSAAVFSMFGGGAKKEKKDDEEERGDVSGSAKAQRDAAAAAATGEEVSERQISFTFCTYRTVRLISCDVQYYRSKPPSLRMSTSSLLST